MRLTVSLFCVALVLNSPLPMVYAHHSSARFDKTQEVTVEGAVTQVKWANPHVYIYIDQVTGSGQTINWEIEGAPPAGLRRMGWSRDKLQVGDQLIVSGNPSRNTSIKSIFPRNIEQGGETLFNERDAFRLISEVDSSQQVRSDTLHGTWLTVLPLSLIPHFMETPKREALTDVGAEAVGRFDERTMNPAINCIRNAAPMSMIKPDVKQIEIAGNLIVIRSDFEGAERTIHLNVLTHDGASISNQGHSIGKWEGETLVIDTTHFSANTMGNGWGLLSGTQKHLVERLTLNTNGTSIAYEFELSDPEFLSAPITGDVELVYRPNMVFAIEECDLDSARRFLENR
ncbi:MAG: hypothetical protein HQ498_04525 [Pseudohongiella sp.]|nr:hypothetical protein [Pseudohongiella sp.]